ncbi:ribosome maturation factor RimM [Clostridium sp. MSJ-11]|uniref:Ribosome maturation factor RimM n=1 Tax=Clostridium mobile TaxID=2841512 RepID=A0ABS6EC54_9CLOT|nr:ribosome maturation factor RimM [Clostridium mobile]MBU5482760.1 ribosome maturation factor RimM [Clostridium mobile]
MKEFLSIGQIINTHGLKGELKVYPLTDDINRFKLLQNVYINNEEISIEWCKLQVDKVILKIKGVDSIEEAMKLKNQYLDVKREDAVELSEGSYFIADLIGCTVYDDHNNNLGEVYDVIQTKNNDVYWVKGKKELLIPALKTIVVNINIEEKIIIIKPVEEWLSE